jgi:hypothetical protein
LLLDKENLQVLVPRLLLRPQFHDDHRSPLLLLI